MSWYKKMSVLALLILLLSSIPTMVGARAVDPETKIQPWLQQTLESQGQADLMVVLSAQADLSPARLLKTKAAKGEFVFNALNEVAERTQPPIRALLDSRGIAHQDFYIVNLILVRNGDLKLAQELAARPDVARVEGNPRIHVIEEPPSLPDAGSPEAVEWNIIKVNADDAWALGYHGEGAVVGGQDTGYDWDHPAIVTKYRGCLNPPNCSSVSHDYNWHDAIHSGGGSCGANSPVPCDDFGHGTHTMGTITGDDGGNNKIGMAPGAKWIGCRNMDQGTGQPSTYLECFQFFLAPTDHNGQNPRPDLAPNVTSNSWGCPSSEGCSANTLEAAVQAQRDAGIMTVASAGNSGSSCSSLYDPPSFYQQVFSVGATDSSDNIASFSSRGPVTYGGDTYLKPEISAPGVNVRSSVPGGGYSSMSGTSMAGPHVAGEVALILSACPSLIGMQDMIETIITSTAVPRISSQCGAGGPPNNVYGWGRIDALAAVNMAMTQCGGMGGLDGHVYDAVTLAPIETADVTAVRQQGGTWSDATDSSGYYTLTVPSGDVTLTAEHPQYTAASTDTVVITDTLVTVDFYLQPRGRLWGYITDADNGFPLAATVSVPGFTPVNTNPATGYYEVYLDAGNYNATASAPNYTDDTAAVVIAAGQDTRQDFALLADVSFSPYPLHVYVPLNGTLTTPAAIANRQGQAYDFDLYEIPGGYRPSGIQAIWPGPDGFGYSGEAVNYEWVEIRTTGTAVPGLADDSFAGPFNVGFSFPFYGGNQTQFYVSSNGHLDFGSGSSDLGADCPFPNAATPNNLIALMWDDLYPNYSTGGVYYQSFSSCPVGAGSCLILEYYNWNHYGGGAAGTFEAILMDNGSIRMQFLDGGSEQGASSGTGIEGNNAPANYGLQYACRTANSIVDGLALCYAYPDSSGCVAGDVPWLGEDPTSGTIPSGGSFDVTMLFTATSAAGVTQPGEYTATLLVAGSPAVRVPVTMTVYPDTCQPVQIITVTQQPSECSVTFGAQLSGSEPVSYLWDFGPFGTSTAPTPTVDFGQTGSYPASLEVTNCGGPDSIDFTVDVTCNECEPVQIISVTSEISGCAVTWSAELTGTSPYEYLWDFGPFGTSTATNPIFDYGQNGAYTGTLTVSNCEGANEDTAALEVTVDCTPPCDPVSDAAFSWTPLNPGAGEPVTFSGTATGTTPISYTWDLGDGTIDTGATIVHTYAVSGTYVVTMVAENGCGEQTVTHTIVVTEAGQCEPPTGLALDWTPPTPLPGDVVTFSGSANGTEPIAYSWDLGDGAMGSGATLTHTYAAAGSYLVVLTATNACGTASASRLLAVAEGCVEPGGANFSWSPITPTAGALVTFDASLITGTAPLSYAWSFGDGATGSGDPATHSYAVEGDYTVVLTITNDCGQVVTQHALAVVGVCEPVQQLVFDWTPMTPTVGQAVSFSAAATGTLPIAFSWSFGDGGTGSGAAVAHTYVLAGSYTVDVTATNGCGVQALSHSLVVEGVPPQTWTVYLPIVLKNN